MKTEDALREYLVERGFVEKGTPREELYRRINERVRTMAERGMVVEVRALAAQGYGADDPGMSGTGYREILGYLEGRSSLEEALDAMQRATRRYARRQLTWFRNQLPADAIRIDGSQPGEIQCARVVEAWRVRCCDAQRCESTSVTSLAGAER